MNAAPREENLEPKFDTESREQVHSERASESSFYLRYGKRSLDLIVSSIGLLITGPLLLLVMGLLYISNRGEVFYPQDRPGLGGRPFRILKFKTMTDETDEDGNLLADEVRTTRLGNLIRKSSLDELLQLVNVFRGEMSLIGPRPLLIRYLSRYTPYQARRHEVRPGITGLAQVNGRNALPWERRFRYDVFYVDHVSFGLDLRILYWTVLVVLKGRGVEFSSEVPWEFEGAPSVGKPSANELTL